MPARRRGAPALATRQSSSKKKADELTRPIVKMTEKFSRRAELPAHLDVAKRVFYSAQGQIRLDYHYAGDCRPGPWQCWLSRQEASYVLLREACH